MHQRDAKKEVRPMARHSIPGRRTGKGERLFYSDRDGDQKDRQTVYREHKGRGGSTKVDGVKYNPKKDKFS